jgi:TolA-binding protein
MKSEKSGIVKIDGKESTTDSTNKASLGIGQDDSLFDAISIYMKAHIDIEEALLDPALPDLENEINNMISDWNGHKFQNLRFSPKKTYTSTLQDDGDLEKDSTGIESEMKELKIDLETEQWVEEWNAGKKQGIIPDHLASKSRNTNAEAQIEGIVGTDFERKKRLISKDIKWLIPLSAASALGIFMIIRSLFVSVDTNRLFISSYKQFETPGLVTRNAETKETDNFSSALEYYKNGDFKRAASAFSGLALTDSSNVVVFFSGLSMIGTGEYQRASEFLEKCSKRGGQYTKEATWYLGLTYLKTGEIEKASECFSSLSNTPGYYSARARKILRRLK